MKKQAVYILRYDNDPDYIELFNSIEGAVNYMFIELEIEEDFFVTGEAKQEVIDYAKQREQNKYAEYLFCDADQFFPEEIANRYAFTIQKRFLN